jgi:Ca2+-binding EF-hand superfamily protein
MFDRADANSDGKITKDEIPEERRGMFERVAQAAGATGESITKEQFVKGMLAMAQNAGGRPNPGQPEGRPGAGPGGPVLRALDADGDGEISASEIADAAKALAKLDRNGDGKLTREEIGPPGGGDRPAARPEGRPAAGGGAFAEEFLKRLQAADANGDKKISKEEAPDRLKENFDRADRNGDGQLDEAELKEMVARMRAGAGGDQPRRRPDGEPKKE